MTLRKHLWRLLLPLLMLASIGFIMIRRSTLVSALTNLPRTGRYERFLPSELEERRNIQEARLHAMHQRCLELNDSWKEATWGAMTVNRQKRVVICHVAKAAGTTWLRVLLRLTGNPQAVKLASMGRGRLFGPESAFLGRFHELDASTRDHYLMGNYYKVMFVRDPLVKLISAYRDKMFRAGNYEAQKKLIKRMFRPNVSAGSKDFTRSVTFPEFVRYVLWERDHKAAVDVHWRPQYDTCRPCHIKWDFLGYYETLHDDAKDVLRNIAAGSHVQFPAGDYDTKVPNSNTYLKLYENVTVSDISRLLDFYKNDYKVFGYKIPDVIRKRLDDERSRNTPTAAK